MESPELRLYNTMSGKKETFKPMVPGKVGMYFCGITPYDHSHVGHARSCVAFDVLFRYLKFLGYEVNYVRNFTDIDDKIIRRANELGEDPLNLSSRFCQEFLDDMFDLQCLLPTHQPRVSDHIEEIIDMINQIIRNDCGYTVEGNVYFSLDNFPNYGQLCRLNQEENIAGKRVAVDPRKRNPADFALWKAAKPGEPSWDSPWGPGRPGWHIECSAMSAHYLTFTFDIHGGGRDLIFPHHVNEIAQSWAACSESNVSCWMHIGSITKGFLKMSKSEGNVIPIREATNGYHPLALRHFLMSTHYRSPLNYSTVQLDISSEAVFYIYQTLQDCSQRGSLKEGIETEVEAAQISPDAQICINRLRSDFQTKMLDDLQTPHVLNAALPEALKFINNLLNKLTKQQKKQHLSVIQSFIQIEKEVREVLKTLGLLSTSTYSEVLRQLKDKALTRAGLLEDDVLQLIEERVVARKNKDYLRGDQIRRDMAAKGIALMDVDKDTIWRPCLRVEQGTGALHVST